MSSKEIRRRNPLSRFVVDAAASFFYKSNSTFIQVDTVRLFVIKIDRKSQWHLLHHLARSSQFPKIRL